MVPLTTTTAAALALPPGKGRIINNIVREQQRRLRIIPRRTKKDEDKMATVGTRSKPNQTQIEDMRERLNVLAESPEEDTNEYAPIESFEDMKLDREIALSIVAHGFDKRPIQAKGYR